MNAREVAAVLAEIAVLLEVVGGNPFRARAFSNAARTVEGSGAALPALAAEGRLTSLPAVGEGTAGVIAELLETGASALHESLRAETPVGLYDLMRVKGLGAKRIRTLYAELGVDSLETLEDAAAAGRVAALPGFGPRTAQSILESVGFVKAARGRRRYSQAVEVATRLLEWLETLPGVREASAAGGLRRRMEVVEAIDLVVSADDPPAALEAFREGYGGEGEAAGPGRLEVRFSDGLRVRLTAAVPGGYAARLVRETGSDAHVNALEVRARDAGLRWSEAGLERDGEPVELADEQAFYAALGLGWVPPELREGWGEVEAAAEGRLPALVDTPDLRGTFHCHTEYSDGQGTVAEMAEAARARGWAYLGISDHSRSAGYAGGLSLDAVRRQHAEIDAWNRAHGGRGKQRFRLFKGIESDILPDGSLDYPDEVLAGFDFVIGSVHSGFRMNEREMTQRLVRAVSHPRLTILGHPTGRLLLRRDGYAVDMEAVLDAAAEHRVAVEINADPSRLDVDWRTARDAARRGVVIAVNPDAHSAAALGVVAYGVNVARKAWLAPGDVLNTRELNEVEGWLAERE